jgi:hypothetical protein
MLAIIQLKIFCLPVPYIKILKINIYKTVTFQFLLYACETLSLTLREVYKLMIFEKRVMRRIFGSKREEDGSWRKLHNDELHSLYSSPNIIRVIKSRRMRWAGHVARMGEGCALVRRPECERPLGRLGRRLEDNIKTCIK